MESKTPSPSEANETPPPRKPYQKPRLQVYGDLSAITQARTTAGTSDGASHPNKHFTA
jgi:hypothetical protein